MTMLKEKSEALKHRTQAALLLRRRLGHEPEANPLTDAEIHDLEARLHGHDLSLASLLESPDEAARILAGDGVPDDRIQRVRTLCGRGFALALKQIQWETHALRSALPGEPEYPAALDGLDDLRLAAIHLCGEPDLLGRPDETVAVRARGRLRPEARKLIDQVAAKIAQSGRILSVRLDSPLGRELALRTAAQGGLAVALTGAEPISRATLSRDLRDQIIEGRLTLWSAGEPDRQEPAADERNDRLAAALGTRGLELSGGPAPAIHQA